MTERGLTADLTPLFRPRSGPPVAPDGIWERMVALTGRNRIAAAFYDGPAWARFRKWERLFLLFQGGARPARRQILRHLDGLAGGLILEVGIGDGDNLRYLPASWTVYGVDLARRPLRDCVTNNPQLRGRLVHAVAEDLPFDDGSFDASYSVGGFTYYGDHVRALAEMVRVTRPGGLLVVADEVPHIDRYGIGRVIPTRWVRSWSRSLGIDPEFTNMILDYRDDPEAAIRQGWPDAVRHSIWWGLGYCYTAVRPHDSNRPPDGDLADAGPRDHA